MTRPEPPEWGTDSLSSFLRDAARNERVTAGNFPRVFDLLRSVNTAFIRIRETFEQDSAATRVVPRFLIVRAQSSILASIRAISSGQSSEGTTLLRSAIEQTWYALHLAKDTGVDAARLQIWFHRNDGDYAKARCKHEFSVANVRNTHQTLDPATSSELHVLYEELIDYGAHPNQLGMLTGASQRKHAKGINFLVGTLGGQLKTGNLWTAQNRQFAGRPRPVRSEFVLRRRY